MEIDSLDDVPDELRPSSVRQQVTRTVGVAMVLVGCLLVAGTGIWWALSLRHPDLFLPNRELHLPLAALGGVLLAHGIIAVVTVDFL